jgi:hypothetical protein
LPSAFVGCLFLVEILLQQRDTIPLAQWVRPRNQGALARDLVMLDRLRCRDEGCIENGLVLDFARDLIGFLNDAVDCWAAPRPALSGRQVGTLAPAASRGSRSRAEGSESPAFGHAGSFRETGASLLSDKRTSLVDIQLI